MERPKPMNSPIPKPVSATIRGMSGGDMIVLDSSTRLQHPPTSPASQRAAGPAPTSAQPGKIMVVPGRVAAPVQNVTLPRVRHMSIDTRDVRFMQHVPGGNSNSGSYASAAPVGKSMLPGHGMVTVTSDLTGRNIVHFGSTQQIGKERRASIFVAPAVPPPNRKSTPTPSVDIYPTATHGTAKLLPSNSNIMSYQQTKVGQSTIVNPSTVPVLPIPNTAIVLQAGVTGTINDLRLLTAAGTPSTSVLKNVRQLGTKPGSSSTTTSTTSSMQSLMATGAIITSTMPTMVTPTVSISPAGPLTAERTLPNTIGSGGAVPIVLQPMVGAHHQQQQQSTLYAGGSKLVLPLGTTIKVTQGVNDQQQPHLQPIPVAISNPSQHPSVLNTVPAQSPMNSITITPQPTQPQPAKLVLNARPHVLAGGAPAAAARSVVVSGNMPPLYVPPNKVTGAGGSTSVIRPNTAVSANSVPVHKKIEVDMSEVRPLLAGGAATGSNAVNRRMSVGYFRPAAGGNAVDVQEVRKPIKAFDIPVLSPFATPKLVQHHQQQQQQQQQQKQQEQQQEEHQLQQQQQQQQQLQLQKQLQQQQQQHKQQQLQHQQKQQQQLQQQQQKQQQFQQQQQQQQQKQQQLQQLQQQQKQPQLQQHQHYQQQQLQTQQKQQQQQEQKKQQQQLQQPQQQQEQQLQQQLQVQQQQKQHLLQQPQQQQQLQQQQLQMQQPQLQQKQQQQQQFRPMQHQTETLPEVGINRVIMMSNSANVPIVLEREASKLAPNVSYQSDNGSAGSSVVDEELSNDGDQLVMDLGESNTQEVEDDKEEPSLPASQESLESFAEDEAMAEDNTQPQGESDQDATELVYLDESLQDGHSNETIEVSTSQPQEEVLPPSTPKKCSPDRANQPNEGIAKNISPRLQKRSSSEHQRPQVDVIPAALPNHPRGMMIPRRRFSEFATVRQPPTGVRIPFTHEHYYIALPPNGRMIAPRNTPLTPIDAPVAANPPDPIVQQPDREMLPVPLPPPPPQDIMLLCNEKLDLPKYIDGGVRKNRRASAIKHPKTPAFKDLFANETDNEPVKHELIALDEEVTRKRQRVVAGEENMTEPSDIKRRSTSTSSDSNMTTAGGSAGKAGRSNPAPEASRKGGSKSRASGQKNATGRSSQVAPSETSSVLDDGASLNDPTTVADHLRWWDGIGYLNESSLRFEFNKFGMVQPLSAEEYDRHCATDVYKDLQQPVSMREQSPLALNLQRSRAPTSEGRDSYVCEVCKARGRAADFITPELCSIKCLNSNLKPAVRKYILNSTHASQQGDGSLLEMKIKTGIPVGSIMGAEKWKGKAARKQNQADKKADKVKSEKTSPSSVSMASSSPSDDDEDSMSSLSLNSSAFLKRQSLLDVLPNSLDGDHNDPAGSTAADVPASAPIANSSPTEETEFNWQQYLKQLKDDGEPAPAYLFGPNAFPAMYPKERNENRFCVGMKLEAIDPENCSLFCVCTVAEVRGYRIKLHFDGYSSEYDFWVNADSNDIFPPGWCQQTNRALQPPASYVGKPFTWKQYLKETNAPVPDKSWFGDLNEPSMRNKFKIGMAIEADDLKKSGKVCVATVADKMGDRILVHFDGWDNRYDYWVSIYSNYIHPVNWHQEVNEKITAPPDWNKPFDWSKYIRFKVRQCLKASEKPEPAEKALFKTRPQVAFKLGHRLEVVDRKQKKLIRPATVVAIDGYDLKLCFDGWPRNYAFWIEDDSPDLHPINWCARTKHPLEPPPNYIIGSFEGTCEFKYCVGRGNAKHPCKKFHDKLSECPYKMNHWQSEDSKPLRLSHNHVQTFVKEEQENISTENIKHKIISKSIIRKSICSLAGPSKEATTKPSIVAHRRRSVATATMVQAKRIKRETVEPPSGSATSTPTPPPSGDPSKERNVRLREVEDATPTVNSEPTPPPPPPPPASSVSDAIKESIRLAQPAIDNYGPQLLHSYEKWREHSRYLDECTEQSGALRKNPLNWTTDEIVGYVEGLPGCEKYAKKIRQEEITGRSFLSLTQADLIDYLGVKMGPATKIYNRIIRLRQLVTTKFLQL